VSFRRSRSCCDIEAWPGVQQLIGTESKDQPNESYSSKSSGLDPLSLERRYHAKVLTGEILGHYLFN
jgi:hypothetical protein